MNIETILAYGDIFSSVYRGCVAEQSILHLEEKPYRNCGLKMDGAQINGEAGVGGSWR